MILFMSLDNHFHCGFPAAQIRKDAKPEDWAAITVALQFYGCRRNAMCFVQSGILCEGGRNVRVNARKRPRRRSLGGGADRVAAAGQSTEF